jgi:ribA/ribD-fused uncharacterized protein
VKPEDRLKVLQRGAGSGSKFVLFWGHRPERDGRIGHGCFSQWWGAPFTVDGVGYPSAEHWMMAAKARLFGDESGLAKVLAARSPGAAKAAGRAVRQFDEDRWVAARYDIVVTGARAKFEQHQPLREVLLRTGSKILVEASPTDRIWGIGLAADHEHALVPSRWRGLNLLGFALMDVRDQLATVLK